MKLAIPPPARDDLADGLGFYERKQAGLGGHFLEPLFSDIDSLRLCAGIHLKVFGYFRLLSKRLPQAVDYNQEAQTMRSWAVLGSRRDANAIRRRLAGLRKPEES